jgi:hypothetical protein
MNYCAKKLLIRAGRYATFPNAAAGTDGSTDDPVNPLRTGLPVEQADRRQAGASGQLVEMLF